MKHVLIILSFMLIAGAAFADCKDQASEYIIRGNVDSNEVGARLWNLQKLKSAVKAEVTCADSLYVQGFKEMNEYWNDIGTRKGCLNASGELEQSETCTDELFENVKGNLAYIELVRLEDKLKACPSCKNPIQAVLSKKNTDNIQSILTVSQAAATAVPVKEVADKCSNVPLKDRATSGKNNDFLNGKAWNCIVGAAKGLVQDGLGGLLKLAGEAATHWFGIPGLVDLMTQLISDPERTLVQMRKNLGASLYETFAARYENWACYNSDKKAEVGCSSVGQGGFVIIETLVGLRLAKIAVGAVRGGVSTIKAGRAAAPSAAAASAPEAQIAATTSQATSTTTGQATQTAASSQAGATASQATVTSSQATVTSSQATVTSSQATVTSSQATVTSSQAVGLDATQSTASMATRTNVNLSKPLDSAAPVGRNVQVPKGNYNADKGLRLQEQLRQGKITRSQMEADLRKLQEEAQDLELKMRLGNYDQSYLQKLQKDLQRTQDEIMTRDQVLDRGTGAHLREHKPAPKPAPEYSGSARPQQVSNYRSKIKEKGETYTATERTRLRNLEAQHNEKLRKMTSEGESKGAIAREEKVRNDIRDQVESLEKAHNELRLRRWEKEANTPKENSP